MPDISGELAQVDDVLQVDLRAEVEEGKRMFEEIPEQVQNDTNVAVESLYLFTSSNSILLRGRFLSCSSRRGSISSGYSESR